MATAVSNRTSIAQLNSFLRGELAAVETYRLALDRLAHDSPARGQLASAMSSHAERVHALRSKIVELGGNPSEGSGAWGAFTKAVERCSVVLGDRAAIAALEEGEELGLRDYRQELGLLEGDARQLVIAQLLPKQEETQQALRALRRQGW